MTRKNNNYNSSAIALAMIAIFAVAFFLGFAANDMIASVTPLPQPELISDLKDRTATANVVAVTDSGQGVIGKANIEIVPGKGRILVNTNPFIEPDTQLSAETAVSYALNYTRKSIRDHDIIVSFSMTDLQGNNLNINGQVIGGPSAGAALTVATIAALENRQIREDVAMTGTVEADGVIGKIGGVIEKADAAGKAGINIFLVPTGQAISTYYEKEVQTDTSGPFQVKRVRYVPKTINLNNYTTEQWNMTTYEIPRIEDALKYALV